MHPLRNKPIQPVLWVDDHPENNEPIVKDLERRGLHISYALSTSLALVLLERNCYSVVISDVGRREGPREGFHLLDSMRARGDETPFLFYASLNAPELRDHALLHDAQGSTNNSLELIRLVEAYTIAAAGGSTSNTLRRGNSDA
jgi:CheY-like chemotaxis protein